MYKEIIASLVFSVLMFFSVPAFSKTFTGVIGEVMVYFDGHAIIRVDGGPTHNCGAGNYYSIGINGQNVKMEGMLSIALVAYATGAQVEVISQDGACQGGEERVGRLRLL